MKETNIIIAGDFCPNDRLISYEEKGELPNILNDCKSILTAVDYSIVNLECPVVNEVCRPITKCGYNLSCSPRAISQIKDVGFSAVTLANNHFFDYGQKGVEATLSSVIASGMDYIGGGQNFVSAAEILYKKINNSTFAFINCCEHEFSIATLAHGGANPLNPISQYYAIQEAKRKADYIIIIVHGGNEHRQLPSPRMKETYHFFIDAGADVVVNHHQHCFSGFEKYHDKMIFYGLGNFCFDWKGRRKEPWNQGFLLSLSFGDRVSFEMIPYIQCDETPGLFLLKAEDRIQFYNKVNELNDIINDEAKLEEDYLLYLAKTSSSYRKAFEPYRGRLAQGLYSRGLLPSLLNAEKLVKMIDYIDCESHRERTVDALNRMLNKKK